jgi:hypothetical protein
MKIYNTKLKCLKGNGACNEESQSPEASSIKGLIKGLALASIYLGFWIQMN